MHDPQFLVEMEQALRELEKELAERIGVSQAEEGPAMNSAVGRLSFIDAFQQHQLDLHAQRKMLAKLISVRAALERLRLGTYGVCENCGIAISAERLEYMPETRFCTPCNARTGS